MRDASDRYRCPEAFTHGPPTGDGRCPWCDRVVAARAPRPASFPVTELTEAYGEHYDPDFGALTPSEVRRRYATGLEP